MSSSIPAALQEKLYELFVKQLFKSISDFITVKLPVLARKKEAELIDQMKHLETRDSFLGFLVIDSTVDTITLLGDFSNKNIPGIPNLKLSVARVAFTITRKIDIVSDIPKFELVDKPYFFEVELTLSKKDNYSIALGGGVNSRETVSYNQYRAEIKWENPAFYLRGYFAKSDADGFLLSINSELKFAIPLGSTGIGLNGIGLLYGEKFAPKFDTFTNADNAIEKLKKATAPDYVKWAKSHDLEKWVPVKEDLRAFGLSAAFVDMGTFGKLFILRNAGLTYLTYGPTIMLGGEAHILENISGGEILGAIDIHSKTLFLRSLSRFSLDPSVILEGSFEISASLNDQNQTWLAIGGYAMNGCRLKILDILELNGGLRLLPFQGAAVRAFAMIQGKGAVLGFEGGFSLSVQLSSSLGWNPVEIGGALEISGRVWVKVLKKVIALGLSANLQLQIPEPQLLELDVNVKVDLPWPLPDFSFSLSIFKYKKLTVPKPAALLKVADAAVISFIHGANARIKQLDNINNEVWPDVMFTIPFQRISGGSQNILNRYPGDGYHNEGGLDVSHNFNQLQIEKIDPTTGVGVVVSEVRACWLFNKNGSLNERTSQLAIPCIDPLSWMTSFEYAQPDTSQTVERLTFQTFGLGPSELISSSPGVLAEKRFKDLVFSSSENFYIQSVLWSKGYERAILTNRLSITFSEQHSLNKLPIKYCELRVLFGYDEQPRLYVRNGVVKSFNLVRTIGHDYKEWSFSIRRDKAEYYLELGIGNGEIAFYLAAVGYILDNLVNVETPPLVVLGPGNYRLTINGSSTASFSGSAKQSSSWDKLLREFTVVKPPLRPYLRYATFGDERIFGLEVGGWNPNPKGIGFGHYQEYQGVVRSRVGYLSKIYPILWVSPMENTLAIQVDILPCSTNTPSGSVASRDWNITTGMATLVEEEFYFELPKDPGIFKIRVFHTQPKDVDDLQGIIDDWTYRVSNYSNPVAHLCPQSDGLKYAYGPFGTRLVGGFTPPTIAADFDAEALPDAALRNTWALPEFIRNLTSSEDAFAGLKFLQCLEWTGIFEADPGMTEEHVLFRPDKPELNIIFDRSRAPVGLLLKTTEPCDWRRVEFLLVTGQVGNLTEKLSVKTLPSVDGCSCLLFAEAMGVPVRLQKGAYALLGRFNLQVPGLPLLTSLKESTKKIEEFYFTFFQPYGRNW